MFLIATDSTADLPKSYIEEHDVEVINLSYILDGVQYGQGKELDPKDFFAMMRDGKMPTTSQVNPDEAKMHLEKMIHKSKEILFIAFSSGLSGSFNSIRLAAMDLMDEYEDCKIVVIDTLAASLGEGILVVKACEMRNQGKSLDEVATWVENHKFNAVHCFTVDDLFHLFRGGRVSRTSAIIGTLAGIKPILNVDNEGHLINIDKVRGRKKSLNTLVDYYGSHREGYEDADDLVLITHGDALEDAEFVAKQIQEKYGAKNVMINMLGPVIGAHTGPGLIALFFMGKNR